MNKDTLGNLCKLHSGGTPSTKNPKYWNGDLKWLSSAETGKDFIYDSKVRITQQGVNESSTKLATRTSVIIATAGEGKTRGQVSFLETDAYINQSLIAIKSCSNEISDLYIYYYLKNSYKRLRNLSDATGIRGSLSGELLKNFVIAFPQINIQNKITSLLRLLDSKIENNNKISSELESMAKTLYYYWFLQFEFPNEEGKPYKSSGGKMVWNEKLKREIPEGWEVDKIAGCLMHINTGLNPRDHFVLNDGNIKYVTVKNLTTTGELDFSGCDTISENTKKLINKRSMILTGDILFASIAPLGRCYIIRETPSSWEINESVFSIRPNHKVTSEYLYQYFMSEYFVKKAEHSSTGSVFAGIRISTLNDIDIVIPLKVIMDKFTNKMTSTYELKYKKSQENQELISLRDFLLPLLMNGQVTFK